jgi:hypothetical protein
MPNTSPKRRREKQTTISQPAQIYELKITLRGSKPPIWRRIAVATDIRLSNLHQVIQVVMGWGNYHLHQFVIRNHRAKLTREELSSLSWQERYEKLIKCRDRCWSDPRMELEGAEDEKKMKLCDMAPAVKSNFIYEYDFGDGWEHEIKVVKIGPPVEGVKYPVCIAGKLACPPEDCGGIWGYYDMLEILKNPKHKQHKEFVEWIGGKFDPECFNLDEVNATLRRLR